jgi:hypothetical protein
MTRFGIGWKDCAREVVKPCVESRKSDTSLAPSWLSGNYTGGERKRPDVVAKERRGYPALRIYS